MRIPQQRNRAGLYPGVIGNGIGICHQLGIADQGGRVGHTKGSGDLQSAQVVIFVRYRLYKQRTDLHLCKGMAVLGHTGHIHDFTAVHGKAAFLRVMFCVFIYHAQLSSALHQHFAGNGAHLVNHRKGTGVDQHRDIGVVLADGELLVKVAGEQSGIQHLQALGVCLA